MAAERDLMPVPLVGMGQEYNKTGFADDYENPRGLPRMEFYGENLDEVVKQKGGSQVLMRQCQEMFQKYKFFEARMTQVRDTVRAKIPEITKNIDALNHLERKNDSDEDMVTMYGLSDVVFTEAIVKERPKEVGLWLGANVMVMYPIADARQLLMRNLQTAQASLESALEDLAWLREQTAVCEVNTNRVHNWEVAERRKQKAQGS
eukprot:TRINITY_DN1304_c3_g1_i1.p1 TRINITY_DN1304_c3_g1~~TRINITY_DN1304_c3_g1_i1.p1  ORF type:complete len:228 (+),score=81.27 TRINITY_DN1304_c3_g1_i1:72-686(+)